ncbi:ATP-binding protein [Massilia sp. LjRoot122]|uniref:hybrid sensor histidine kinase/response regulator n=1 Tax=Massilia sp. LjRoot122 TaxID=3342257 RepID=UPI003ECF5880
MRRRSNATCQKRCLLNFTLCAGPIDRSGSIKTETTLPDSGARHTVRFYDDERLLLAEVAAFLDTALAADGAGHAAGRGAGIVIATPAHLAALRRQLGAAAARVRFLDAADTLSRFMVDGWPDESLFRAVIGPVLAQAGSRGGPVHAFGEMVALLCMEGCYDAAVRLEQLWNLVAADYRFALFCAYPWTLFKDEAQARAFEQVCAEHHCAHGHTPEGRDHDLKDRGLEHVRLEQKVAALEAEMARLRESEEELRWRERELADFVENAVEGLHRVGPDGTILWANRAELQMLGYRWEEYVGRHIAEFHLDAEVIDDILGTLKSGGTLYDRPARLRCKDGSVKQVVIHSNGCFDDGRLRYTRCFTRDATERHQRDAALAQRDAMLLNAPVAAALLVGPELRFHLANRRYCELAGRTDLAGKRFGDCFPQLRGGPVEHALEQVFETGKPFCAQELRIEIRNAAGKPCERYFRFSLEALEDAQGVREGVIVVVVEVTEHVHNRQQIEHAQRERERMLAELSSANQAKDEFLAMLGHELRNPLSPIVTALQLMRMRDGHGDGQVRHVRERDIIQRQVDHLVRLVDDLLDVSRVTRGKIDLKPERIALAQVLGKAVEMASLLIEQRRHRLEVEIEDGLEWVCDPVRLAQVVSNLLTNAARYTEPGGQVQLRAHRDGASAVVISVADNGIGLAPEMRSQVFDLFFQGKRSVDRAEGGLGIGLALVKNIVALHGGTVEARSEGRGRGSEFVVRLPLGSAPAVPAAPDTDVPAVQRRVLIVDDNVDGAETLGSLLAALGHTVEVYHDPVAALAAFERLQPEVALLDIGLPVLDGYQLAARIRALPGGQACRLVALTGYGQEADRARSQAGGFERHLVKPISPGDAARVVAGG